MFRSVRIATIPVFASILVRCSETEVKFFNVFCRFHSTRKISSRLFRLSNVCTFNFKCSTSKNVDEQRHLLFIVSFSDSNFRTNFFVQNQLLKTFARICSHVDSRFRDDFLYPTLSFITVQSSNEIDTSKRSEIISNLFETYKSLSKCSNSQQSILNHLLPGLYCLRSDFAQFRAENIADLDSLVQQLENQLVHNLSSIDSNSLHGETKRGRVLKSFDHFRDSTEKFTYRWMKKK